MKLKIKQVNSSPEYQQKQQENEGDREILKEEVVEVEDNGTPCQFLNSAKKNLPSSSKSSDTNKKVSNLPEWLPTTPVSQNQVKRKRRPKLLDEISLVTFRRRKKKPSDPQSAQFLALVINSCVLSGGMARVQVINMKYMKLRKAYFQLLS